MKFHGIHKKWQYKTVTGKYGCFRRPLIHLLRQPDPPSTSRWDDVYCDYHASCAKRMLGLTHLTCSIFTAALTAMPCAHKKDISAPLSDEDGVGLSCWQNGIFIRGFVRLGFLEWGQERLQRHMPSIQAQLMRIICYQSVQGHGWGHLIPGRDESIQ